MLAPYGDFIKVIDLKRTRDFREFFGFHCDFSLQLCCQECEITAVCYLLCTERQPVINIHILSSKPSSHQKIYCNGDCFECDTESAEWKLFILTLWRIKSNQEDCEAVRWRFKKVGMLRHEEINAFLSCLKGVGGLFYSSLLTPEMKGATERVILMNTTTHRTRMLLCST